MKSAFFYTSLVVIAFFFAMNTLKADQILRMKVKENKVPCTGVGPMECLVVKYKGSKGWTFFYSEIKGFDYKEGFQYTLLVNRKKREGVPADASAYAYELVKIIKKRQRGSARKEQTMDPSYSNFLTKHKWKLIQMNREMQDPSPAYMIFDKEKGKVNGVSGCNRFFGSYQIEGNQISFGKIAGTLMTCAPEVKQIEASFLSILKSEGLHFDIADQTLNVYKGDDLLLMFGRAPL